MILSKTGLRTDIPKVQLLAGEFGVVFLRSFWQFRKPLIKNYIDLCNFLHPSQITLKIDYCDHRFTYVYLQIVGKQPPKKVA